MPITLRTRKHKPPPAKGVKPPLEAPVSPRLAVKLAYGPQSVPASVVTIARERFERSLRATRTALVDAAQQYQGTPLPIGLQDNSARMYRNALHRLYTAEQDYATTREELTRYRDQLRRRPSPPNPTIALRRKNLFLSLLRDSWIYTLQPPKVAPDSGYPAGYLVAPRDYFKFYRDTGPLWLSLPHNLTAKISVTIQINMGEWRVWIAPDRLINHGTMEGAYLQYRGPLPPAWNHAGQEVDPRELHRHPHLREGVGACWGGAHTGITQALATGDLNRFFDWVVAVGNGGKALYGGFNAQYHIPMEWRTILWGGGGKYTGDAPPDLPAHMRILDAKGEPWHPKQSRLSEDEKPAPTSLGVCSNCGARGLGKTVKGAFVCSLCLSQVCTVCQKLRYNTGVRHCHYCAAYVCYNCVVDEVFCSQACRHATRRTL